MLCEYGCGNEGTYMIGAKFCCKSHYTKCPAVREKNSAGLSKAHEEGLLGSDQLNRGWARGLTALSDTRISANYTSSTVFGTNSTQYNSTRTSELTTERGRKCEKCGITEWVHSETTMVDVPLKLFYADGDKSNGLKENLTLLCHNCHAVMNFLY